MSAYVSAPHNAGVWPSTWSATEKQLSFLNRLREERITYQKLEDDIAFELEQPAGPSRKIVSELIDDLLLCEKKPAAVKFAQDRKGSLPEVPAGRYAVPGADGKLRFVKVDRPEDGPWMGRMFVSVQASDDFFRLRGEQPRKALDAILAAGIEEAARRYGREIGKCCRCGRTLTDEDSRARGVGPVCAAEYGWAA